MSRRKKLAPAEIVTRLIVIKVMVADLDDAMPTLAAELRRGIVESLDDLIGDVARSAPSRPKARASGAA